MEETDEKDEEASEQTSKKAHNVVWELWTQNNELAITVTMVTRPSERCELRVTVVLFSFFPLGSSENTNKRIASYCIDSLSKAVAKLVFNRFS